MLNVSIGARFRLLLLLLTLIVTIYFVPPQSSAATCAECVSLTGGLCVGCDPNQPVHATCVPNQTTCTCEVGGECPGGGG
jgi:hypothetical protein